MPPPREVNKKSNDSNNNNNGSSSSSSTSNTNNNGDGDERRIVGNRYRVEKKLGSGNFGTAFLVTDLKDNDQLKVLKEISVGDMQPDESIESVHEANLLSKLDNPYIIKYNDSFLDGDYFCIVTEYCEGGDLDVRFKKLKKENKKLSEEQILDWTVQLLSAVNYMHSRRVLHRDLKARNIFLKREMIKIGDFGISRILQGTMDMAQTFTGTPYYMSPEVLKHEGYNSKSDIWSIGCLIYEMCTFNHAFEGQGLMGVMYKIVEGRTPEIPNIYSRELNLFVKKIFRKDPAARPSSSELLREPFIVAHIKGMIERLKANSSKIDDLESTMVIRNDRAEIARAVSGKVLLRDLQQQRQSLPPLIEVNTPASSMKSVVKATPIVQQQQQQQVNRIDDYDDNQDISIRMRPKTSGAALPSSSNMIGRETMTPKERLLQNKLKKADEEAAKVGQMARDNYEEKTLLRQSIRREATSEANQWNKNGGAEQQLQQQQQMMIHYYNPNSSYNLNNRYEQQQQIYHSNPQLYQNPVQQQSITNHYEHYKQHKSASFENNNSSSNSSGGVKKNSGSAEDDDGDSADDVEGTLLKTLHQTIVDYHAKNDNNSHNSNNNNNTTNGNGNGGTLPPQPQQITFNAMSPRQTLNNKINPYDSRPIQPMRTRLLDGAFDDDGIPIEPSLTNKYYENYENDFENDSSPERKFTSTSTTNRSTTRNSMSKTIAPMRRRVKTAAVTTAATRRKPLVNTYNKPMNDSTSTPQTMMKSNNLLSKTVSGQMNIRNSNTNNTRQEYEQLIDAMQNALISSTAAAAAANNSNNNNKNDEAMFGDDSRNSVFGAKAKATKIQNLRAQAIRKLGPETFEKVYNYLREQRTKPKNQSRRHSPTANETMMNNGERSESADENRIFNGLKEFTSNTTDCFLVDQLLFLEES